MTDRRLPPADIAHQGEVRTVAVAVTDLRREPGGARDRQLIYGDDFRVLHSDQSWAYGARETDGYMGYLRSDHLTGQCPATHFVSARSSHLYPEADFKSEASVALSFGARLTVIAETDKFAQLQTGQFIPRPHIRPINQRFTDPVDVAELFLGTPYLWGGNSIWGIDCSGLAQIALLACGLDCPGDADLQEASIGRPVPPNEPPQRGDVLFWKGHVGLLRDPNTLLHANAYHMAVVSEPLDAAVARIKAQGDGDVTQHKRL
ncbi:MAG: NLP/P60 hydrolase [Rhodobacterales bacterium]|nr:MAG: NLP/P60 hydrolase [Rhodobacterales bacterium]